MNLGGVANVPKVGRANVLTANLATGVETVDHLRYQWRDDNQSPTSVVLSGVEVGGALDLSLSGCCFAMDANVTVYRVCSVV